MKTPKKTKIKGKPNQKKTTSVEDP